MRILYCGDVVGKSGRRVVLDNLPRLRAELALDFVIVNGENAAHGFGITEGMCDAFLNGGADVLTTGNHVWDRREIMNYIEGQPRLLRPINYPEGTPGKGWGLYEDAKGRRVLVVHPMGRLFMDPLDDPFAAVERVLATCRLGKDVAAIVGLVGTNGDFRLEIRLNQRPLPHQATEQWLEELVGHPLVYAPLPAFP